MTCTGELVAGHLLKQVALTTKIGNRRFEDLEDVWDPWPNDMWGIVPFFGAEDAWVLESAGGDLFATIDPDFYEGPDPARGVLWVDTGEFSEPGGGQQFYNIEGQEVYFRWLPARNTHATADPSDPWDEWEGTLQFYDFGESGTSNFTFVLVEIVGNYVADDTPGIRFYIADDFDVDVTTAVLPWDPDTYRWYRFKHDPDTGIFTISTASAACDGWTERASSGVAMQSPLNSLTAEIIHDVFFDPDHPAEPGYFGEWNEQPVEYSAPLSTLISTYLVPGNVLKQVPLNVEIVEEEAP